MCWRSSIIQFSRVTHSTIADKLAHKGFFSHVWCLVCDDWYRWEQVALFLHGCFIASSFYSGRRLIKVSGLPLDQVFPETESKTKAARLLVTELGKSKSCICLELRKWRKRFQFSVEKWLMQKGGELTALIAVILETSLPPLFFYFFYFFLSYTSLS